jgi:lipoprotein-anchoring transpeptidase ErfK/SrfK
LHLIPRKQTRGSEAALLGISVMRAKFLFVAALAAFGGLFAFAPRTALANSDMVAVKDGYAAGTIVVHTSERRLYLMLGGGQALRYPVGVGRAGMQWAGTSSINGKYVEPAWSPPAMIRRENPRLPDVIPSGSSHNPMGVAAMTLAGGEYAIHGTNEPGSIGHFVSHGCIRMYNADITDLYQRVSIGTTVVVTR